MGDHSPDLLPALEQAPNPGARVVELGHGQRQVLYLGKIHDTQQAAWCKTLAVFQEGESQVRQMVLFPADRVVPELACEVVSLRLSELQLHRPRQWGACWLACQVWDELQRDQYWGCKPKPQKIP